MSRRVSRRDTLDCNRTLPCGAGVTIGYNAHAARGGAESSNSAMVQRNPAPPKILVVDDDVRLRDLLSRYLTEQGLEVATLPDARDLDKKLQRDPPHLIVLDLMLPGEDGLAVCRRLRGAGENVPIIMLTAKGEDVDRIVGLEMGADDYLPKPFNPRELVARIHAVLRRQTERLALGAPAADGKTPFGPFVLDFAARTLSRDGEAIHLTTGEFSLVRVFAQHPRQPLAREKLMLLARGRDHDVFDRAIDVQVSRLRKLIEPDPANPRYIQTVWGFGYVFVPDEAPRTTALRRDALSPLAVRAPRAAPARRRRACAGGDDPRLPPRSRGAPRPRVRRHQDRAAAGGARGARVVRCERAARDAWAASAANSTCASSRRPSGRCWASARRCCRRCRSSRPGCASSSVKARRCASRRAAGSCSSASTRRALATGSAFRCRRGPQVEDEPWRAIVWSLISRRSCFLAAFGFARYLARPLRELNAAVERVGRGESPPPLPEGGPSEIAKLNRGFNRMTANLPPVRAGPRAAARGRVARPAHAARAAAARDRDGREGRGDARGHGGRHRGDGPDHRSVPRVRAHRSRRRARAAPTRRRSSARASTATCARAATSGSRPASRLRCRCGRPRTRAWSPT